MMGTNFNAARLDKYFKAVRLNQHYEKAFNKAFEVIALFEVGEIDDVDCLTSIILIIKDYAKIPKSLR